MQLNLFDQGNKSKTIEHIPITDLEISKYNPRKTRPPDYIQRLAERIERNGFEITRALWVYSENGTYKVFAGGTRLQASRQARLKEIPCVVHVGFTEDEIVGLADLDNENDEYHEEVSIVDTWMSYLALARDGWTQQRIADAKGVSQKSVSNYIRCANLPKSILDFSNRELINERHAIELLNLVTATNPESAMLYVIEQAGAAATAKDFKALVAKVNDALSLLDGAFKGLPYRWQQELRKETDGIFDQYTIQKKIDKITHAIAKEKREIEEKALAKLEKAKQERLEAERIEKEAMHRELIESVAHGQWWQLGDHLLYCGDTSSDEFMGAIDKAVLAFADPPYNAGAADWDNDFNWRHDALIELADIVAVTPGISSIFDFAKVTQMPYRWSLACWISNGMTRGALGFGNWIYTAIFSKSESIHRNKQDFSKTSISNGNNERTKHKGRKPDGYMDWLLDLFTEPGDLVIDPFLGSGTTLLRCEKKNRRCVGGEIDQEFCKDIIRQWEVETNREAYLSEQNTVQ